MHYVVTYLCSRWWGRLWTYSSKSDQAAEINSWPVSWQWTDSEGMDAFSNDTSSSGMSSLIIFLVLSCIWWWYLVPLQFIICVHYVNYNFCIRQSYIEQLSGFWMETKNPRTFFRLFFFVCSLLFPSGSKRTIIIYFFHFFDDIADKLSCQITGTLALVAYTVRLCSL